jgi:hypothetical protein
MDFPETVILSVTVHGSIHPEEDDTLMSTFKVPEGMRIKKISAVAPGVCNVTSETQIAKINNSISSAFKNPVRYEDVDSKLPPLIQSFKHLEKNEVIAIIKDTESTISEKEKEFMRHTDKGNTVVEYLAGQEMIQKRYSRSVGEGIDDANDFKITALNVDGKPDMLSLVISGRSGATTTRASEIEEGRYMVRLSSFVNLLQEKGVKNIVLFDFSCSDFYDTDARTSRALRNDAKRRKLNGGKKTETRRRRKRLYNGRSQANTLSLPRRQQATRRHKHSRKRPSRTSTNA